MGYGSNCTVDVLVEGYMMNPIFQCQWELVRYCINSSYWRKYSVIGFVYILVIMRSLEYSELFSYPSIVAITPNTQNTDITISTGFVNRGALLQVKDYHKFDRDLAIYFPTFVIPLIWCFPTLTDVSFTIIHHGPNRWNYAQYLSEKYTEMSWSWVCNISMV